MRKLERVKKIIFLTSKVLEHGKQLDLEGNGKSSWKNNLERYRHLLKTARIGINMHFDYSG